MKYKLWKLLNWIDVNINHKFFDKFLNWLFIHSESEFIWKIWKVTVRRYCNFVNITLDDLGWADKNQ